MKFKIGDRVTVIRNLEGHRHPGDPGINQDMIDSEGKTLTIKEVFGNRYKVEENWWTWIGEWFVPEQQFVDIKESELMNLF